MRKKKGGKLYSGKVYRWPVRKSLSAFSIPLS
jgi:hypothetical protein